MVSSLPLLSSVVFQLYSSEGIDKQKNSAHGKRKNVRVNFLSFDWIFHSFQFEVLNGQHTQQKTHKQRTMQTRRRH